MKILNALLLAVPCLAATHIHDATMKQPDGVTPAVGRIVVQGFQRNANGQTALTGSFTVPIVAGVVDFTVEGGPGVHFEATVYLTAIVTTPDGKTVEKVTSSYQEPPWAVVDTSSTLTIRDIRGGAVPTSMFLAGGNYCITVAPPAWTVVSNTVCGGGSGAITWSSMTNPWSTYTGTWSSYH